MIYLNSYAEKANWSLTIKTNGQEKVSDSRSFHIITSAVMNMFGLLVSGRLVDTSFREVDPTHALIDIVNVDSFNHVVVFLTGAQPFPDGMGGAVYFSWPDPAEIGSVPSWQYLGNISNMKPSAIFKIAKLKVAQQRQNTGEADHMDFHHSIHHDVLEI